jgi:creatinine amidohydrolase
MRLPLCALLLGSAVLIAAGPVAVGPQSPAGAKGQRLADLAWPDAERLLTPEAVVVIPLGAGSKEHGPHLKLGNDYKLAEYLTGRIVESTAVVVAPTVAYHYYPAFLEYPGSTSLTLATARESVVDVVRTLARYGPRRFYVLNTGVSTVRALEPAAAALATDGTLLRYTALSERLDRAARGIREQAGGTHADEIETSMMLYIDPASVDMSRAVKDYTPSAGPLKLTRTPGGEGTYSASGIWGDPTLATRDKGHVFVDALVAGIGEDIQSLRTAALPARTTPAAAPAPAPAAVRPEAPAADPAPPRGDPCTAQSVRAIMAIGDAYATAWANGSAIRLGELWSDSGNIIHTDGTVERGAKVIAQNRLQLFARPEYRGSRHPMSFNLVRCLTEDIAVADGKWELRGLRDAGGRPAPPMQGQVTIVARRAGESWKIEAYRYTVAAGK